MPTPAATAPGNVLAALAALGYADPAGAADAPTGADMMELLAALTLAAEELSAWYLVADTDAGEQPAELVSRWANGYLAMAGAGSPCGDQRALDLLIMRIRTTAVMLAGNPAPLLVAVKGLLMAAANVAAAHSVSGRGGEIGGRTRRDLLGVAVTELDGAADLLTTEIGHR